MRRPLLIVLFVVLVAIPASSYQYLTFGGNPVKWKSMPVTIYHDSANVPAGVGGNFASELQAALNAWNGVSGSSFQYRYGGPTPSASPTFGNGCSECYFYNLPPMGYAVTIVTTSPSGMPTSDTISERDVQFNVNASWTTSATNTSGGPADFRTVAIHELGHVLGLMHESSKQSIMATGMDPAFAQNSIYTDDRDGVRFLYPATGPGPGPGPTGADLLLDSVSFSPIDAAPGDTIGVTWSMRNTGTAGTGNFRVGIYLTGSLRPLPTDRRLALVEEADLPSGISRARTKSVAIPGDLLPGSYRIGVLLDTERAVVETNLTNNGGASPTAIRSERDPVDLAPGQGATGSLGPLGRDLFTPALRKGTKLKLRAKITPGTLWIRILHPETGNPVLTSKLGRSAKGKLTIPADGDWVLSLQSRFAGESFYERSTRPRTLKTSGRVRVEGETRIPLWV